METTQKNNYTNNRIASKKGISIIGIIILIIAAAIFYTASAMGENSVANMSLFILGIALCIVGFVKLFMGKQIFYLKENGTRLTARRLTFSKSEMNRLQKALEEKKFDEIGSMKQGENKSSDIRLEIFISLDKQYASAQIMEFIPFEYQAARPTVEFTGNDAERFAEVIA